MGDTSVHPHNPTMSWSEAREVLSQPVVLDDGNVIVPLKELDRLANHDPMFRDRLAAMSRNGVQQDMLRPLIVQLQKFLILEQQEGRSRSSYAGAMQGVEVALESLKPHTVAGAIRRLALKMAPERGLPEDPFVVIAGSDSRNDRDILSMMTELSQRATDSSVLRHSTQERLARELVELAKAVHEGRDTTTLREEFYKTKSLLENVLPS